MIFWFFSQLMRLLLLELFHLSRFLQMQNDHSVVVIGHVVIRGSACTIIYSPVQFSSLNRVDSLRPHESQHARPSCPSPTPGVHSDSYPSSWWCHPAISSPVIGHVHFSCSCKRISFNGCSPLVTVNFWRMHRPLRSSLSRLLSPLQNLLNHHCTVNSLMVPEPTVLLMLQAISTTLQHILKLNKKIIQICFCLTQYPHSKMYKTSSK